MCFLLPSCRVLFLLLVLHQLDVIFWNDLVMVEQELFNIIAHIALDNDLFPTAGQLRDTAARRKFLPEIFCHLLVI
jgi:hypothetical protein